jgi:hypothetical protein
MKYLILVHVDENAMAAMSPNEDATLTTECLDYDDELKRNGHYIGSNALQPVRTATIVRVRNNKLSTTDGPFVETKEQLGGYILIEARDLNEAIQVAAKIPMARIGSIEIRPVLALARETPSWEHP